MSQLSFKLLRIPYTDFHCCCMVYTPLSLSPSSEICYLLFLDSSHSVGVRQNPRVVLTYIPLMVDDVKWLLKYLLPTVFLLWRTL